MKPGRRRASSLDPAAVASARHDRIARERRLTAVVWDDGFIRVRSSSDPTASHSVAVSRSGRLVRFACDCTIAAGLSGPIDAAPGVVPCSHAAAAADLLDDRGLAAWDGHRWRLTPATKSSTPTLTSS